MKKYLKGQRGQSATEYMLVIAVIVLGIVSAASHFIPKFDDAVSKLSTNITQWLSKNQQMDGP